MNPNALIPFESESYKRQLSAMSDEQVYSALADELRLDALSLLRKGLLVLELERRGKVVDIKNLPLLEITKKVALGQLSGEAAARFLVNKSLWAKIRELPLDEQQSLASGKKVKVLTFDANGKSTHYLADPLELQPSHIAQVFAKGRLRSESEQALYIDEQLQKARKRKRPEEERIGKFHIDRTAEVVTVGRQTFTFKEWKDIAKTL